MSQPHSVLPGQFLMYSYRHHRPLQPRPLQPRLTGRAGSLCAYLPSDRFVPPVFSSDGLAPSPLFPLLAPISLASPLFHHTDLRTQASAELQTTAFETKQNPFKVSLLAQV